MSEEKKILIGFCGQGFVGGSYADDMEERGISVVRYSLEEEYKDNKEKIKDCKFTFIAVPTPTTPNGFNFSILEECLHLIGDGNCAIIKSTIIPGTAEKLQEMFPNITILHSPEFLTEATAKHDAKFPNRNIIGYINEEGKKIAEEVMEILPNAPYKAIVPIKEAEMIKYANNVFFYWKIIYVNMLYDLCEKLGINYDIVKEAMKNEPMIGSHHLDPIHKGARGAGNACLLKDGQAFANLYKENMKDDLFGKVILNMLINKNLDYMINSGKDLDLIRGVYGEKIIEEFKN